MDLHKSKSTEVPIRSIVGPKDLGRRMGSWHVRDLAESIRENGLLQPPTVNRSTNEIVAGRDRYAAHILLGRETIEVVFIDVEEIQAKTLEIVENLNRRHSIEEQRELRVALYKLNEAKERLRQPEVGEKEKGRTGPKSTPKSRAIKKTCEQTNVHETTLRRDLERKAKAAEKEQAENAELNKKPPVETFGLKVNPRFLAQLKKLQDDCKKVAKELESNHKLFLKWTSNDVCPEVSRRAFKQAMTHVTALTKGFSPVSICPSCKLIETLLEDCPTCYGKGYCPQSKIDFLPAELLSKRELFVQVGTQSGQTEIVPYDSMFDLDDDEEQDNDPLTEEPIFDDEGFENMFTVV